MDLFFYFISTSFYNARKLNFVNSVMLCKLGRRKSGFLLEYTAEMILIGKSALFGDRTDL